MLASRGYTGTKFQNGTFLLVGKGTINTGLRRAYLLSWRTHWLYLMTFVFYIYNLRFRSKRGWMLKYRLSWEKLPVNASQYRKEIFPEASHSAPVSSSTLDQSAPKTSGFEKEK